MLSSASPSGGFNDPDSVITGCHHNAAASALNTNSIHLHFQEQRPNHWWIVIIREWQSTETTEAWTARRVWVLVVKSRNGRMCPLRYTLLPRTAGLYITAKRNTERQDGERAMGQGAGLHHSYTDTHENKHTEYPHRARVRVHTHTNSLADCDPDTQRGCGSTHQPFIACCSDCWQAHTDTHSHRSGHRLQPNTKPQAVIEADWSAPLYFQSIYSVHPGLYILIMCSASFPKRRGDRVC